MGEVWAAFFKKRRESGGGRFFVGGGCWARGIREGDVDRPAVSKVVRGYLSLNYRNWHLHDKPSPAKAKGCGNERK